jgi:hypothetical protein
MKRRAVIAMPLLAAFAATSAESTVDAALAETAATGVSRAVFLAIRRFYKLRGYPGELTPAKEYPIRISFAEGPGGGLTVSHTESGIAIAGSSDLSARQVKMKIDDADTKQNKERASDPSVWVEIKAGRMRIESGFYECSGTFTAGGRKVVLKGGSAEITNAEGPVLFTEGTELSIDGTSFVFAAGRWSSGPK